MFYHFTYQVFFCYCCHCLLFVCLFIYMLDYKRFLVEILKSVIFILKSFPPAPYTQLNWQGLYTKPCLPIWGTAKISSQLFNLLVIALYFQFRSYPSIWAQFICRLFGFLHCGTLFLECPSQFFSLSASFRFCFLTPQATKMMLPAEPSEEKPNTCASFSEEHLSFMSYIISNILILVVLLHI